MGLCVGARQCLPAPSGAASEESNFSFEAGGGNCDWHLALGKQFEEMPIAHFLFRGDDGAFREESVKASLLDSSSRSYRTHHVSLVTSVHHLSLF